MHVLGNWVCDTMISTEYSASRHCPGYRRLFLSDIFITVVTMVQKDISNRNIGKVYSFRTATMYLRLGAGLLLASFYTPSGMHLK